MTVPSEEHLLARQHNEQIVITLPEEIDVTNSARLREALLAVISPRLAVIVADMTATTFCDSSGANAIVTAYRQAVAVGADMRLVISHPATRRVFELSGIDTVISIYPDLPAAPRSPGRSRSRSASRPPRCCRSRWPGRAEPAFNPR
jgi:anti-sigma B factor antagonist